MNWAVLAPVLATVVTGALTLAWKQGKTDQKVADLKEDATDIKMDLHELRVEVREMAIAARTEVRLQIAERNRVQRRDRT